MLIALDVGNTTITAGLADDLGWRARWRLTTDAGRTADEYGALFAELLDQAGIDPAEVDGAVLSSVVPALTPIVVTLCGALFGQRALVVGPGVRTGMEVRYDPPGALGADRLVDALAARERFGAPVVVVDFGTATTFNVVDASGAFVGGAIAPGVQLAADALAESGARLPRIDLAPVADLPVVGRTTESGMRAGTLYGYAGLVEGLLGRIEAELGAPPATVVATGGMAGLMAPLVPRIGSVVPDLTLDGLRHVHALNRGRP